MSEPSKLKPGDFIRYNDEVVEVLECYHRKPARLREFWQVKFRTLKNGQLAEVRFLLGDTVELLSSSTRTMQVVSADGNFYVLMDCETYEQLYLAADRFGGREQFLKADLTVSVLFVDSIPMLATIPDFLDLKVTSTAAPPASAPAAKTLKPAKLETGAEIQVPLVIKNGDIVKVDTRTEEFVSRVSSGS